MSEFYMKNKRGEYIPVSIEQISGKDWDGKVIHIKLGSDSVPAMEDDETQMYKAINNADPLANVQATYIITTFEVNFETIGDKKELQNQTILIRTTPNDVARLSSIDETLEKKAKRMLRENGVGKNSVTLPAPLTVQQYKDVMEIKRRCDIRRERRG